MGIWKKVKNSAKKVGKTVKKVVETAVDAVSTVVNVVIETVESTVVGWVGGVAGYLVSGILSFPIIGHLIDWAFQIVKTIIWRLVGVVDFVLSLIGITPEKKMRICVIALKHDGVYFATDNEIINNLNSLIQIFKDEANVRVVHVEPFNYTSPFSDVKSSNSSWIHFEKKEAKDNIVDVNCTTGAAKEDITTKGYHYDFIIDKSCFYGNFRRLIGYGAPIAILVVRRFKDGKLGCSLGPLTDYVTASGDGIRRDDSLFAHECGHACGLTHCGDFPWQCKKGNKSNLLFPKVGRGTNLNRWQVAILRNSRHVTYL